jgi:hypothetical protein
MGQEFQAFFGNLFVALDADTEFAVFDAFEGGLDLLGFLQALHAETLEDFVAGYFGRTFLEIGFGSVFFKIFVYLAEFGDKIGEAFFQTRLELTYINHCAVPDIRIADGVRVSV